MQAILNTSQWVWVDYAIAVIIGFSALIGLVRGFIKEAFALVTWGSAIFVGVKYNAEVALLLQQSISFPSARMALAFAILFFATLILGAIINFLLSELVNKTGLSGSDRIIGVCFGLIRGALVVVVLIMLAGLTPIPNDPWWKQSLLIPPFQSLALWLKEHIPSNLAGYINFS